MFKMERHYDANDVEICAICGSQSCNGVDMLSDYTNHEGDQMPNDSFVCLTCVMKVLGIKGI